jgi:hypothetical protein
MKVQWFILSGVIVFLVVLGTSVGYTLGGQSVSSASSSISSTGISSSLNSSLSFSSSLTSSSSSTNLPTTPVKVFFSKCDIGSPFFDLSPVERVTSRKDVATFAMEEYFKGPTETEKIQGLCRPIGDAEGGNKCGISADFTISVTDGVATYKQCRAVELGDGPGTSRFAEAISKNISQFNTVSKVIVLDSNGNCLSDLSGLDNCLK